MPAVTNGAELTKRLAATGTGESKIAAARKCLADVKAAEDRVATAAEVLKALEAAGAGEGTLAKARSIAETGEAVSPESRRAAAPIEEQLLAEARPADPKAAAKK